MACPDKVRLQQLYEVAVRQWAQVQATFKLFVPPTVLTEAMRTKALAERNAANNRLIMHQQNCKTCRPKAAHHGT
jgi:hypothetical protein